MWPRTASELVRVQRELGALTPPLWRPAGPRPLVAGCFVCFGRGGAAAGRPDEPGWAAAVLLRGDRREVGTAVVSGTAGAPYEPGLLALREGPLLEAAVRALPERPEVLIANASGRDHPAAPGLPSTSGLVLDLPSVGVTDRPFLASGDEPAPERRATSPLLLGGAEVARALRTRAGAAPSWCTPGGGPNSMPPSPSSSRPPAAPARRSRFAGRGERRVRRAPRRRLRPTDAAQSSIRNPTFRVTWWCATRPSSMWPRIATTSYQSRCRSDSEALAIALFIASVTPSGDDPVISTDL